MKFRDEYDTYIPDFDDTKSKGSGPARNLFGGMLKMLLNQIGTGLWMIIYLDLISFGIIKELKQVMELHLQQLRIL